MRKLVLSSIVMLTFAGSLFAQRVTYPQLVFRSETPQIFIDELILPAEDGQTSLAFLFRFNHDFIPFKKIPVNSDFDAPENAEFYSTMRLSTEIYEGELKRRQNPSANSVTRDFWSDTLYASSFEETRTNENFAAGFLETKIDPGTYNFILQLSMMQEINERNTQRREIRIPDLKKHNSGEVYLVKGVTESDAAQQLELMNLEDNVPYGEDFFAAIRIPNYDESGTYSIAINQAKISRNDTTSQTQVYTSELSNDQIFTDAFIELNRADTPSLALSQDNGNYTYAVIKIPAAKFENAGYILTLNKEGQDAPSARSFFRSYWADMPASLYNLDIAIRHLKYILSEEEVDRINKGNTKEREKKFREFWEQRDPTPNTVYNELMAEYYRRIDYAYNEYGSQENPMGHESDQGEVYIKFGPPDNTERRFPERGRTVEVWEYPSRTFVFESTTGFGDFKLVGTK